jgi:hypothetical protein
MGGSGGHLTRAMALPAVSSIYRVGCKYGDYNRICLPKHVQLLMGGI